MSESTTVATTEAPATSSTSAAPVAEPKTYREHYAAVQAAQSKDQEPAKPAGDDTSETQTAEETKTEDQPVEAVETEDTLLTPEEVSKLSGKELDLYKKAQKNYTQKTQKLAAREKELAPVAEFHAALSNPETAKQAVTELAQRFGILPKAEDPTVQSATQFTLKSIPAELQPLFQPILEEFGKNLRAEFQAELTPIRKQTDEVVSKSIAESTTATLTAFGKDHPGWEKHEAKMIEIGKSFQPTGNMTEMQYLDALYKLATYDVQSAEKTKQVVEKMKKAAEVAETPTQGVQSERVEYARPTNMSEMSSRDRFKAAHEAAKRNQKWV